MFLSLRPVIHHQTLEMCHHTRSRLLRVCCAGLASFTRSCDSGHKKSPPPPKKKKRLFCTSCYSHPSKTTNAFSRVLPCFPFVFLQTFSLIPAAFSSVTMFFLLFDSTDWAGTNAAENPQKTFLKIKGDRITTPQKGLLLLGERAQGFCFTWKRIQWSVNFSAQHNRTVETPLPRMQTIAWLPFSLFHFLSTSKTRSHLKNLGEKNDHSARLDDSQRTSGERRSAKSRETCKRGSIKKTGKKDPPRTRDNCSRFISLFLFDWWWDDKTTNYPLSHPPAMAMQLAWIFVIVGPIDIDEWKVIERRRYRGNKKKRERVRAIKTADGQINCHNELRTQMRSAEIRQKKKVKQSTRDWG